MNGPDALHPLQWLDLLKFTHFWSIKFGIKFIFLKKFVFCAGESFIIQRGTLNVCPKSGKTRLAQ
jgi:hypothetical protein